MVAVGFQPKSRRTGFAINVMKPAAYGFVIVVVNSFLYTYTSIIGTELARPAGKQKPPLRTASLLLPLLVD